MANRNIISAEVTGPVYWSAVIGGIFVALVVHILLNMLGAGIGAASLDIRAPTQGEVQGIGWGAFAWWSVAGIVAAFAGGWAAGVLASAIGSKSLALKSLAIIESSPFLVAIYHKKVFPRYISGV